MNICFWIDVSFIITIHKGKKIKNKKINLNWLELKRRWIKIYINWFHKHSYNTLIIYKDRYLHIHESVELLCKTTKQTNVIRKIVTFAHLYEAVCIFGFFLFKRWFISFFYFNIYVWFRYEISMKSLLPVFSSSSSNHFYSWIN